MHDENKAPDPQPRRKTVLLVEHDILLRTAAAEALRNIGLVVLEAATAKEAVSLIAADLVPDALFIEAQIPGDADGVQLAEQLKALHPGLSVFIASSNLDARVDAIVTHRFLRKPYDLDAMVSTIRKALGV